MTAADTQEIRRWIHELVDKYFDKDCAVRVEESRDVERTEGSEGKTAFKALSRTLSINLTIGEE